MAIIDFDKLDTRTEESQGTVITLTGVHYVCKTKKLDEIITHLPTADFIHWKTNGEWSMHELLLACIQFTGPADVYISSYAFSETPARLLADLKSKEIITQLHCLIDSRIDTRSAGALQLIQATASSLKLMNTHAKVTVLINDHHSIAISGSANYTKNERIEVGYVSTLPVLSEFNKSWIVEELLKSDMQ